MAQRLLRIVTLASRSGKYGGPFDTASRQAVVARDSGWDVRLLAGTIAGDAPDSTSVTSVFPMVRKLIPMSPGFTTMGSVGLLRALWTEIGAADVIHVSTAREFIPLTSIILSLLRRKRVVAQPHGMLTARRSLLHIAVDLVMRPLMRRVSTIIALTEHEAKALNEWARGLAPISVLGNPLPSGLVAEIRETPRKQQAIFAARLHARKRVDVFSQAAFISSTSGWDEEYVAFGPDEGELGTLETAVGACNGKLVYGGTLSADEVTEAVRCSGVFVLPSSKEPWGNVLATALGAGLPVVVSSSASFAQMVSEYQAGIVVSDGDPQSLAAAVHKILTAPGVYDRCSRGAFKLAQEELSSERQILNLNAIYNTVSDVA